MTYVGRNLVTGSAIGPPEIGPPEAGICPTKSHEPFFSGVPHDLCWKEFGDGIGHCPS